MICMHVPTQHIENQAHSQYFEKGDIILVCVESITVMRLKF